MPENYDTIQEAMAAAEPGDTVFVAAGTYTDVNEVEIIPGLTFEAVVNMKPGVTLLGNPEAPESVIIQGTESVLGIFCQNADSTTSIIGLTVTGSMSGIMGRMASPTISNCRLIANQSASPYSSGGGMYGDYFSPTISDCVFTQNAATSGGGATFANESFPVLHRCTFTNNHAITTSQNKGHGGGLTVVQSSVARLYDCVMTGNEADSVGGAFNIRDADVHMVGGSISQNLATYLGGGFALQSRTHLELTNVTVTENMSTLQGGGFFLNGDAVLVATQCRLGDNTSLEGADGFLMDSFSTPSATLICCDIDPDGWEGIPVVIDDEDCEE